MTLLIVGAVAYYLFFMGGINTIKGIIGFGGGDNNSSTNNNDGQSVSIGNGGANNVASNVNSNSSGSHGNFQQTTDINGVVTKKSFSFYGSPRYI